MKDEQDGRPRRFARLRQEIADGDGQIVALWALVLAGLPVGIAGALIDLL